MTGKCREVLVTPPRHPSGNHGLTLSRTVRRRAPPAPRAPHGTCPADAVRARQHLARREYDVVSLSRVRLLRTRLFGEDGPRTVGQFLRVVLVLALCLYFVRGGLNIWQAVVLAAVFGGAAILVRTLVERNRQKRS